MKRDKLTLEPINHTQKRSNSQGNLLAKRLYRNNSSSKLSPLDNSSIMPSLNTSLIPSISLRKLNKLDSSHPSIEISHGKIQLRRSDEFPYMSNQNPLKKKASNKKFEKIDMVEEKSILPDDLKGDYSAVDSINEQPRKFKPSRKWLSKLKQGKESLEQKLTPEDFIQLIEEEGGLGNEFCYLQKGDHPYDLQIVEFANTASNQYITISARGVTYFNWEGSRFVTLEEWKREAELFSKLMQLQFFGKYKLHKNFSNWKKYSRKTAMKKTKQKLQAQLLVQDRFLREALLQTRGLCCRLETETNYCYLDDSAPPLPFQKFKNAQENFLNDKFEKRVNEVEQQIKCDVATCLGVSMRQFKQLNKISSNKEGKGLPLLNGDEKNLEMPYTKEATLRVQQEKFKRFLKLVDLLVVHSKINMMDYATVSTARKLEEENEAYKEYVALKVDSKRKGDHQFKGKQYIECLLQLDDYEERAILRPSREELSTLIEDIVNRSTIKLIKNHRRIINDPDIIAILYEGNEEGSKDPEPTNTLKTILGAEQKQEEMVEILNTSINVSYNYLQDYVSSLSPLIASFFKNCSELTRIHLLTPQDFFSIRQWIDIWRKQLTNVNKLYEEHESAVFLLNIKQIKDNSIQCLNLCITKIKQVIPKILQAALHQQEQELRQSLRMMEVIPIGIEVYIEFQNNKNKITNKFDEYDERLLEIGQLIEILKDLGGLGENVVIRCYKQRKELTQIMKALKAKVEESEMNNKVHETHAQQEVKKLVPKIYSNLEFLYSKTKQPRLQTAEMVEIIQEWEVEFNKIDEEFRKIMSYQRILGMEVMDQVPVHKFSEYFKTYKNIWNYKLQVQHYQESFFNTPWKSMEVEDVKMTLQSFLEQAEQIKKGVTKEKPDEFYQIEYIDEDMINTAVQDIKKKIKPALEAIECLRDPSVEEREQKAIRNEFENKGKRVLSELVTEENASVSNLLDEGLVQQLDFLKKVVFKSKKQLELNSKMGLVSRFWGQSMGHSSKGLIDNFAQQYWAIAAQIDEKITVINCVRQDPQVEEGQFRMRVQVEKNLLDSLRQLLSEWQKHHNYLSYFQPIFSNPYWKGTGQYKAYTYAESNWKKLIKQISKDFSLRKLATQQKKHLSILKENNGIFEDLKHSVQVFLNVKREAFPKLYFLSNEQLLHLLLQDKDYSSIDKHLSRIFPHLKSLELNQERNCPLALKNNTNQSLQLRTMPPKQIIELEEGLRVIEQRMKEAIKSGLLKCCNYYMQDEFNLKQWINDNILQVLLFIGNSQFTKLLEYDYLAADGEDLNQLLSYQMTQIKELSNVVREDMSQFTTNHKYNILLMQAGHFRDIILRLMHQNVRDDHSFEWQRQVRIYYNGNDQAVTKYLTKTVQYGYEFVCPTYNYVLTSLSERHLIELVSTSALNYLPVLVDNGDVVAQFCTANAKSHFSINLQPLLSSTYLHNLCQGALASSTFLEIKEAQHLSEQLASLISNFICEAKCILDKKELFNLSNSGKNNQLPSFNVALRISSNADFRPIQQHIKVNYRVISMPEVPISLFMNTVCQLVFPDCEKEFAAKVEKACEIVNKCSNFQLLAFDDIRNSILSAMSTNFSDFKLKLLNVLLAELSSKIVQQEELKYYEDILKETILHHQVDTRNITKIGKDVKTLMNFIVDIVSKKQLCILVGPNNHSKKYLMLEAYKTSGIGPVETYYTDLMSYKDFYGNFENGLWKEGIFAKRLKHISSAQQEWFLFEGEYNSILDQLLRSISQGSLLLENGELLYLSPNWKFLIATETLGNETVIHGGCQIICTQQFATEDEQIQHSFETVIRPYFKTNVEGYSALKNICLNNFEKILKFRVKGRFHKAEHLRQTFVSILESTLMKCPQKNIQAKDNQSGLEKLFLWCIYWTFYSSLSEDNAKKFESQLFEQIKIEVDRSIPISTSKFEMDTPSGSYKRIESPVVTLKNKPYYVSAEHESIMKFIELYLTKNKNVLLIGNGTCGKSHFMMYIKENLGEQHHSFLCIKVSKHLTGQKFQQLLYRKAKIGVSAEKKKYLTAINGKKLVIMLDDVNTLDERSLIGIFLRSILSQGYYFDHITLEKIYLNNVSVIASQNSSYEFTLGYEFIRHFKPIHLPSIPIRNITDCYISHIKSEQSVDLCNNVASLYEFATIGQDSSSIYERKNIGLPVRILEALRTYEGKESITQIWKYVSLKEYVNSFSQNEMFRKKITAEIKNYSNLMLKDNHAEPQPISNMSTILGTLQYGFSFVKQDPTFEDYYIYFIMKMQLNKMMNLFTINEPLCPSSKLQILELLCRQSEVDLVHPYRAHQITAKASAGNKILVYASNSDTFFDEILELLIAESKDNVMYAIDFSSKGQWIKYSSKYPSLLNSGSRYFKPAEVDQPISHVSQSVLEWCDLIQKDSLTVTSYERQQIQKNVSKYNEKLIKRCEDEKEKFSELIQIAEGIRRNTNIMKGELEVMRSQLGTLSRDEEVQRKQLSQLKNSYDSEETEADKNARNSKIQVIEAKLNEFMALKRSGEDQHRTKSDEYKNQQKILKTVNKSMETVEEKLTIYNNIFENSSKLSAFLALTDYYYSKQDKNKMNRVKQVSKYLPLPFEAITKHIYECEFSLDEHAEVVWILNEKSIVIHDDRDQFADSIQKKYPKSVIFRNPKDLEDFNNFEEDTAYIFVGELRSELNYINDMSTYSVEKEYRDHVRGKDDGKDEKYLKEARQEKPNYNKNIYFVYKQKDKGHQNIRTERQSLEGTSPGLRSSRYKQNMIDGSGGRRPERRTTRVPTYVNQLLAPVASTQVKKRDSSLKQKILVNIKQELILRLKYKQSKETDTYQRNDSQLEDLLIVNLGNCKYHNGGKKILSCTDRYGSAVSNITFVCKKALPKTEREELMTYSQNQEEKPKQYIEELLETSDPFSTSIMKNEQRELDKFIANKLNHEKIILEKIKQNSPKSLSDLGFKDGQFQTTLSLNILKLKEKLANLRAQRQEPYGDYFQFTLPLWNYLQKLTSIYPEFKISKQQFKDLVIDSLVKNKPQIQENGEQADPKEKFDIANSREGLMKRIVEFVVISLNYQDTLMALTLLSIDKESEQQTTERCYFQVFSRLIHNEITKDELQDVLNKKSCSKQLKSVLDGFSSDSESFFSLCQTFVEGHLNIKIDKEYSLIKAQWVNLQRPIIVISHSGANPFSELTETRKAFFVKENSEYPKCAETMLDRGLSKLVLVNFVKDENRLKISSLFEEWPKEEPLSMVYLYTDPSFYEKCQFKALVNDYHVVNIAKYETFGGQLGAVLDRNIREGYPQWMEKVLRTVLFIDLRQCFQNKICVPPKSNNCFFATDLLNSITEDIAIRDGKEFVQIIAKTIFSWKERELLRQSKKYMKFHDNDNIFKVFFADVGFNLELLANEHSNFLNADFTDFIAKVEETDGCLEFAQNFLTTQEKNKIYPGIFKGLTNKTGKIATKIYQEEISQKHWKCLDNITFESFKNFESVSFKKQKYMVKKIVKAQNSRNYILFRWIEHHLKTLKQIDRNSILSEQTKFTLIKIYLKQPIFGLDIAIDTYLTRVQQKIKLLQEKYHDQGQLRKIDFAQWSQIKKLVYLHLYSLARNTDISKANVVCRLLNEKQEKTERGWIIDTVELKNCKFDQAKGCLEINDRNDNKKIHNILITLCDKELSQGFSLPLMFKGEELFRLDIPCRFKEDASISKENITGSIIVQQ